MIRARIKRWGHLMWQLALMAKGGEAHQAITLIQGWRTKRVMCTCGREWH